MLIFKLLLALLQIVGKVATRAGNAKTKAAFPPQIHVKEAWFQIYIVAEDPCKAQFFSLVNEPTEVRIHYP